MKADFTFRSDVGDHLLDQERVRLNAQQGEHVLEFFAVDATVTVCIDQLKRGVDLFCTDRVWCRFHDRFPVDRILRAAGRADSLERAWTGAFCFGGHGRFVQRRTTRRAERRLGAGRRGRQIRVAARARHVLAPLIDHRTGSGRRCQGGRCRSAQTVLLKSNGMIRGWRWRSWGWEFQWWFERMIRRHARAIERVWTKVIVMMKKFGFDVLAKVELRTGRWATKWSQPMKPAYSVRPDRKTCKKANEREWGQNKQKGDFESDFESDLPLAWIEWEASRDEQEGEGQSKMAKDVWLSDDEMTVRVEMCKVGDLGESIFYADNAAGWWWRVRGKVKSRHHNEQTDFPTIRVKLLSI